MAESDPKLSLALIVKNESRCLARCLKSVKSAVDEIVVVDTGSNDDSATIAQQFGARMYNFSWLNDFSAARNFSLQQTSGDWILVLDADEYASEALTREIREFIRGNPVIGRLRIVSEFLRHGQKFTSQALVSRLFPRGPRFEGRIHEQLVSPLPRINLQGELWHDGYLQPTKTERNISLLLREIESCPDNAYLLFQVAIEYTSVNQPKKACDFLERAFAASTLKEPFAPNLVVDYLYSLSELKENETALSLIEKAGAKINDFPDFHLACGLFYMNLVRSNPAKYINYLPKIEGSFKQCLALGETNQYKSVKGSGSFLALYNLGTLYHVFGNAAGALECFTKAAQLGYLPAEQMLRKLGA
jgi:glycosyltransferase involved in cell wall biosynthesis